MNDRVANFGEQVGTLLPRLRRFARALTRHPQDADDLVQLAVERALTRSTQWRPDSSLTNWMLAIVRNAWIDETRSRHRRDAVLVPENEAVEVGDTGTDRDIEWWSIQSALGRLPEEQRLAVALVLIEGLSYREAAQVMEVPIGTLTSRLARGRLALQAMLTDPVDYARGARGLAMTVTDEELMAYVDGELDAARLESLRLEIAASADLSRRVAEQRALRDRLHRAFDPALHEPVPARLTELTVRARVVEFGSSTRRRPSRVAWLSGLALAAGIVLGIALGPALLQLARESAGDCRERCRRGRRRCTRRHLIAAARVGAVRVGSNPSGG